MSARKVRGPTFSERMRRSQSRRWAGVRRMPARSLSKLPILALNHVGKSAVFNAFSRTYVGDPGLAGTFFGHDDHGGIRRRRERYHKRIRTGSAFNCIHEAGIVLHDSSNMDLRTFIEFHEHLFLAIFTPFE